MGKESVIGTLKRSPGFPRFRIKLTVEVCAMLNYCNEGSVVVLSNIIAALERWSRKCELWKKRDFDIRRKVETWTEVTLALDLPSSWLTTYGYMSFLSFLLICTRPASC